MRLPGNDEGTAPAPARVFAWLLFWALVASASVAAALWIHARDTAHGDVWDWSDWLEAAVAGTAAGLIGVGLLWVVALAISRAVAARRGRRAGSARRIDA